MFDSSIMIFVQWQLLDCSPVLRRNDCTLGAAACAGGGKPVRRLPPAARCRPACKTAIKHRHAILPQANKSKLADEFQ
ncbi:MAG: hypothetical protein DWI68_03355 [Chloroflexi bacterium]|nr:MAG: hypothetical protein DWI68_03355 [Chloroflexota bacterium]